VIQNGSPECILYWLFDDTCVCLWRHGYIGITTNWIRRLRRHRRMMLHAFRFVILFRGSKEECQKLEHQLRPHRHIGWNVAPGGNLVRLGAQHSDEAKKRMSIAAAQRPSASGETRQRLRIASTGRTNRGRIGQKKSEKERRKIALRKIGKPVSEETRRKLSLRMIGTTLHRGHPHTEETKQIISTKKIGIPVHSEEHKRNLAERWQGNALTKGKPWSASRRLAWLQSKET
jgi:NUMOD3 motif